MKKIVLLLIILATIPLYGGGKQFGLGIILGEPTGLSGKYWLTQKTAVDGAAAWSVRHDNIYLHADFQLHQFYIKALKGAHPHIYFGIGAATSIGDNDGWLGVRVPVGGSFFPVPELELFAEIVPGLALIPDTNFFMNAGIGIRYFF